jgi:hypothetical protein
MKLYIICLALAIVSAEAASNVSGISDHVRHAMFWANKKVLHGFCSAYNNVEYSISPDCFNEQF